MRSQIIRNIFLFSIIFLQNYSFAQNYCPFPSSNAYWSEKTVDIDPGMGIKENYYTIFIDGDSLSNGILYHKLYESGIENNYSTLGNFLYSTNYTHVFAGLFREDSLKHIYLKFSIFEYLLYDFNLQLNDTLNNIAYRYILAQGTYVSAIDSVIVGTNYRKRYHLTAKDVASDYITLVEGVGSSFGFLNFTGPPFEQYKTLFCFRGDNENYILDSIFCSYTDVTEKRPDNYFISFFPNPSTGIFHSNFQNTYIENISIYNSIGLLLTIVKNNEDIDLSSFGSGIYIAKIKNKKDVINLKLIVN